MSKPKSTGKTDASIVLIPYEIGMQIDLSGFSSLFPSTILKISKGSNSSLIIFQKKVELEWKNEEKEEMAFKLKPTCLP